MSFVAETSTNSRYPIETDDLERLITAMRAMPEGVEIKTRRYRLKQYKKCFLGNEAVRWLIDSGSRSAVGGVFTSSTERALEVGNAMIAAGLLSHVTSDHSFKDEMMYYRFTADGPPDKEKDGGAEPDQEPDSASLSVSRSFSIGSSRSSTRSSSRSSSSVDAALMESFDVDELRRLVGIMRVGVKVAARTYHLVTYEECFVGSEGVSWLKNGDWRGVFPENSALATSSKTTAAAVAIGDAMIRHGLLSHVTEGHQFKDGTYFYRFADIELNALDAFGSSSLQEEPPQDLLEELDTIFEAAAK